MRAPAAARGWTRGTWALRTLLVVLPVCALATALPHRPDTWVVVLVVAGSVRWAWLPDDLVGVLVLLLVAGWCAVDGPTDWRVGAVAVLLLAAHVVATLGSYGPATLAPDRTLVRLWVGRGLLAVVPLGVALAAVELLATESAPRGLWSGAVATVAVLVLLASRVTHSAEEP